MQPFSQVYGHVPMRSVVQSDGMDDDLRRDLWNFTHMLYVRPELQRHGDFSRYLGIWIFTMKCDADHFPGDLMGEYLKKWIKGQEWYRVYDLLQELVDIEDNSDSFNVMLDRNLAGYRLLEKRVVPISDEHELDEIKAALATPVDPVKQHLRQAIQHLSDREEPDYPNSIKESISATESFLATITGKKKPLGEALKELKQMQKASGRFEHPALLDGWSKMYGWSSDEHGIRHGGTEVPAEYITQALARYVLITCSAFINLLIAEQAAGHFPRPAT
ncbi:hypothetical protein IU449_27530 [Nocardia higoensis]|uniref:HEPN AbiJ-N-terminal domain-containing protein n=1 Tax=Nocardia higoensis TaxID=228599 RepID=A0ABS0DIG6_9NOCA|nr:hypothetical protein [Nocardia higoensis]MBF6358253.1 hypothetical protein [Nocardia higoensis]